MITSMALMISTGLVADTVHYEVTFSNVIHNEARIEVTFPANGRDTLEVRMSRSSPGRYAIHEFAKNVYSLSAMDRNGQALEIIRNDPYRWLVVSKNNEVKLAYTLFANRADGTYSQINETHAHLNIPASFAWAYGLEDSPISINFVPPSGSSWTAATQLVPGRDGMHFTSPNLDYFLDSPVSLAKHDWRQWTIEHDSGIRDTIRIAMHHLGSGEELDVYTDAARRIVAEQIAIFGEAPRFDHGTYTFIATYLPWASGDGMEHRNSTILTSNGSLERNMTSVLGTLSHEFFHVWNVERIRPKELEPFNFFNANATPALWFAEGFTSYYTPLALRRAQVTTVAEFANGIGAMLNTVINSPARSFASPVEMSIQAPFVDAATSVDPVNRGNTFLSYYTWGAMIGLGLDLKLRSEFKGKSLDGYMRQMWIRYGKGARYEVPRPYSQEDLQRELADYTNSTFAENFFKSYIRGRDVAPYRELLLNAGLILQRVSAGSASIGNVQLSYGSNGATVSAPPPINSPLYISGISSGDIISSVNGERLSDAAHLSRIVSSLKPGNSVSLSVISKGSTKTIDVVLQDDNRLQLVPIEDTGASLTTEQLEFRKSWLSSMTGLQEK